MINILFSIENPWVKENFKNLFCRSKMLAENKAIEFEIIKHNYYILEFNFKITSKQDHAGLTVVLSLFGYGLHLNMYDTRHWDYENNCWEVYTE